MQIYAYIFAQITFCHVTVRYRTLLAIILLTVSNIFSIFAKLCNNTKTVFRVKEYGRTELASLYSPGISPHSAWCKLRRWLALVPGLTARLAAAGYDGHQRSFTPAQVNIIVEALGEP